MNKPEMYDMMCCVELIGTRYTQLLKYEILLLSQTVYKSYVPFIKLFLLHTAEYSFLCPNGPGLYYEESVQYSLPAFHGTFLLASPY